MLRCQFLMIASLSAFAFHAGAVVIPNHEHHFPVTPHVDKQVNFWEAIFSKYPAKSVLIHDKSYPEAIIDLVDFEVFEKKYGADQFDTRRQRDNLTEKYIQRYELGLNRFKSEGRKALRYGAIEQRLYNVYRRDRKSLRDLFKGNLEIRSQSGLADEFAVAAKRADKYLLFMEQTFNSEGLPVDLTRLAFVESMFNVEAISKVGASGIWQFMPATARRFMRVSSLFDERNSPFKATRGAAKLLKENYQHLRSWPLAITAYNHGKRGMQRAVKAVGSTNFDRIILGYNSKNFGYASKNFYAEFIAARNVYNSIYKEKRDSNLEHEIIPMTLGKSISLSQLLRYTPLDKPTLKLHNPCILDSVFKRYIYNPLPSNYELFLPKSLAHQVKTSLSKITPHKNRRRI